jgi:hypothetical protein
VNQSGTVTIESIVSRQLVTPAGFKNDLAAAAVEGQLVEAGQQQLVRNSKEGQEEQDISSKEKQHLLAGAAMAFFRSSGESVFAQTQQPRYLPPVGSGQNKKEVVSKTDYLSYGHKNRQKHPFQSGALLP